MEKILWIIFYIISGIMIFTYLFSEKKVTKFIDTTCEKYINIERLKDLRENSSYKIIISLILLFYTIIALKIDYTFDSVIQIKNKIIIITVLSIALLYLLTFFKKYYYNYILAISMGMIFFGKNMFAIDDKYFTYLMIFSILTTISLLFISKEIALKIIQKSINILYVFILVIFIQTSYLGNYAIPTGSMESTILVGDRILANNIIYKFSNPKVGDIISFKEPLDNNVYYTKRLTAGPGDIFKINEDDNNIYLNGKKSSLNREYSVEGILKLFSNPQVYVPKKGDKVKLLTLIELDLSNNNIKTITSEEFLKYNIEEDEYKNVFGIWNQKTLDQVSNSVKSYASKRFTYVLESKDNDGSLILPILDFKYDKKIMRKLLNNEEIELNDDFYIAMGDNTTNSNDSRFFGYVKKSRIYGRLLFRWYPFDRIGSIKND